MNIQEGIKRDLRDGLVDIKHNNLSSRPGTYKTGETQLSLGYLLTHTFTQNRGKKSLTENKRTENQMCENRY